MLKENIWVMSTVYLEDNNIQLTLQMIETTATYTTEVHTLRKSMLPAKLMYVASMTPGARINQT